MPVTDETDLRQRVAAQRQWYHTLDLAPGVVTPGWFDLRELPARLPIPSDLSGQRCLDIGTFDGFWAYELERRGASEVVAIDLLDRHAWDWPVNSPPAVVQAFAERKGEGVGFDIASEALGSSVKRREMSVYDLDPADVGRFDFVYFGSLLLHLQNPVKALEAVRSVCRGQMLSVDAVDVGLTLLHPRRPLAQLDGLGHPWWWKPNVAAHIRMVRSGGFEMVGSPTRFLMPAGPGQTRERITVAKLRSRFARNAIFRSWKGDPHCAVLARPV